MAAKQALAELVTENDPATESGAHLEQKDQTSIVEDGRAKSKDNISVPGNSSMPTTVKPKKSRKRELGKLAKKAIKKSKRAVIFSDTDLSQVWT